MLGHFTLAIPLEQTFILGLILVAAGTGLLKPNISSIVGQLYSTNDDEEIPVLRFSTCLTSETCGLQSVDG